MDNYFLDLSSINVNNHTEKKNGLTYLSWAWAWSQVKSGFPDANYTIYQNESLGGFPYFTDGKTAMVKTSVTVNGIEHVEFLPIMDNRNKSIPVENITSFDVNKAIQRSLTKCCARHGLGLYIYAGEDLPESDKSPEAFCTCEECNGEVVPTVGKNGKEMSVTDLVIYSRTHFGKTLCSDCMKKQNGNKGKA